MNNDNILKDFIRGIVREEFDQLQSREPKLESVAKFCEDKELSRTALWRARKRGEVKTVSIGGRVFVDLNQFHAK